jgi:threonylcarbamoyladenosine tRNA methylthiotransferase MtaB
MKKAAITTLGCKVNQVETSSIVQQLIERNYEIVDFNTEADIYIINTCTVTNRTDFKSRNLIRQALKHKALNATVRIIVTGCYAQKERDEIVALGEIDLIVDNQSKIDLHAWLDKDDYQFTDIMQADTFNWIDIDGMHERTRAFLKVQDGCNYYCAYCAVPYGRGPSRSMDFADVLRQANSLVEQGYQEIVLTGINIGLYQDKKAEKRLPELIKALVEIDKLKLLRISSIEPDLFTDELLNIIEHNSKICPHFHVALQSGTDSVLKRMGRKYSAKQAQDLIIKLNAIKPDCAIGLDIITGFPGETDEEFQQTYYVLSALPIAYLHVFVYSKRKGTPAATMPNQIHGDISKQRSELLIKLSDTQKQAYLEKLLCGKVVLNGVVETVEQGIGSALSDHYIRIYRKEEAIKENDYISGAGISLYKDGILI